MVSVWFCVLVILVDSPAYAKPSHFLSRASNPNWNGTSLQDGETYGSDYPRDENGDGAHSHSDHSHSVHSHSDAGVRPHHDSKPPAEVHSHPHHDLAGEDYEPTFSPATQHSAQWYVDRCVEIRLDCEERKEDVESSHAAEIRRLEEEYKQNTQVVDSAEQEVDEAEHHVSKQKTKVNEVRVRVDEARTVVKKTRECPAELKKLEEELQELEAKPDESDEDIDEECRKKKEIMKKERCVEVYYEAKSTLSRVETTYSSEREELSEHRVAASDAEKAVRPHVARTDEAKEALDEARRSDMSKILGKIDAACEIEMEELKHLAEQEVDAAEAEYRKHQRLFESRKEHHQDLEEEVKEQRERVRREEMEVEEARKVYEKRKHCPAELAKAKQELDHLQATPNESDEDIDAECKKRKEILQMKRCVDKYHEAEDVLIRRKVVYSTEKEELKREKHAAHAADGLSSSYKESVKRFEEAWEAAKAARRALQKCAEDDDIPTLAPQHPQGLEPQHPQDLDVQGGSSVEGGSSSTADGKGGKGGAQGKRPDGVALLLALTVVAWQWC